MKKKNVLTWLLLVVGSLAAISAFAKGSSNANQTP